MLSVVARLCQVWWPGCDKCGGQAVLSVVARLC